MYNDQVKKVFSTKKQTPCPNTDRLISRGYRQKSCGYISYAKELGITNPSQYWHLLTSWCSRMADNAPFDKRIQCGELLFWMAEVINAVDDNSLNKLADEVISKYINDRRSGNKVIQDACFDKIATIVRKS